MRQALGLAARARGRAAPNPMVGSVIVRDGRVIARGYHHQAGLDHGEVDALRKVGMHAEGATVYVTLEPCNHTGRTGPCSEALIAAGVARVVCGMLDPNPHVSGGGIKRLRAAGIAVETGVLEDECRALNEAWLHFITTGRPLVTLKAALTLDGRLAARGGDSRWVSGEESRLEAHRLRDQADAILVGARTVEHDDPALTTRLPGGRGKDPQRVILDGKLSLRAKAKAVPGAWIFATRDAPERPDLTARGAEIVRVRGKGGRVELRAMLEALGKRGVTALLVEGGGEVHGQLVEAGLADRVALFLAPKLIGAGGVPFLGVPGPTRMASAFQLTGVSTRRLGDDILVTGAVAPASRKAHRKKA
jgi:diaminohydroxyphosphoribosylaminopyrimidine deaminase/5-amino-6-(5-phosphoribosylamino)uracil reductase